MPFEYRNIVEPFLSNAQRNPDRLAVVFEQAHLTYRDIDELSLRIARVFIERGVKPGDKVAYLLPNRAEIIAVYIAIQRMGAVSVPLNYRIIPREIAFLVNSVDVKLLVFDQQFLDKVRESKPLIDEGVEYISVGVSTEFSDRLFNLEVATGSMNVPLHLAGGPSRIQFTGGSTGVPKGACRSHAADLVEMHAVMASNGMLEMEHPVALVQCPLEHHGGHSWFMSALCANATVVVCGKFNPDTIFELIQTHRVTHMILLPPTTYRRLASDGHPENYQLESVRIVQSAAGIMTPAIIEAIFGTFPNAEINYGWGQTESGVGTTMRMTREQYAAGGPELLSIGKPMETLELRLVDETGNEVPVGETGEALARTPAVMDGYYGQPELTEAAFTDGWLHTGDVMCVDEQGFYYIKSRKKDMIKSGGENVFINEVQDAILRNPLVVDCVVFGTGDRVMGEAVAAVVQPAPGATLTKEDIQAACKEYIASYKKPRYVVFIDDLGRDEAGKIRLQRIIDYFNERKQSAE